MAQPAAPVTKATTYSLWLVPAEPALARLQGLIDAHAAAHALPRFAAHITLIGQTALPLPALAAACTALQQGAARALAVPMADAVAGLDAEHWRFRCVYLLAAQPHPAALLALHAAAEAALGLPPQQQAPFMPHLSLAYSDCDAATRSAWAAQVRGAALAALGPGHSIRCAALQVWDTSSPDPAQWACVADFPLPADP